LNKGIDDFKDLEFKEEEDEESSYINDYEYRNDLLSD
jgi:hypothetical protein